uniref:Uncharacterized protein n=1 Tax=Spirodela intermedia TaxID=51605 RepID=A0A8S0XA86_SPIIN
MGYSYSTSLYNAQGSRLSNKATFPPTATNSPPQVKLVLAAAPGAVVPGAKAWIHGFGVPPKRETQVLVTLLSGDSTWIPHLGTKPVLGQLCDNGTNPQKALMLKRPMHRLQCSPKLKKPEVICIPRKPRPHHHLIFLDPLLAKPPGHWVQCE